MLDQRNLGALTVSELGLGCMGMSFAYGPGDDDESIRTIHRALELGVTFLDTADIYGAGRNEERVAAAGERPRQEPQVPTGAVSAGCTADKQTSSLHSTLQLP